MNSWNWLYKYKYIRSTGKFYPFLKWNKIQIFSYRQLTLLNNIIAIIINDLLPAWGQFVYPIFGIGRFLSEERRKE